MLKFPMFLILRTKMMPQTPRKYCIGSPQWWNRILEHHDTRNPFHDLSSDGWFPKRDKNRKTLSDTSNNPKTAEYRVTKFGALTWSTSAASLFKRAKVAYSLMNPNADSLNCWVRSPMRLQITVRSPRSSHDATKRPISVRLVPQHSYIWWA